MHCWFTTSPPFLLFLHLYTFILSLSLTHTQEEDKRRKAEVAAHAALNGPRIKAYKYAGPDFEEGPHSTLSEEEFFDALEMAYKTEEDREGTSSKTATDMRAKEKSSLDENAKTPTKSESGTDKASTEHQV